MQILNETLYLFKRFIFTLQNKLTEASKKIEKLRMQYPDSPRVQFCRAKMLDAKSEELQSNSLLEESIEAYLELFDIPNVPRELLIVGARRCSDRQSFRGEKITTVKFCLIEPQ